ncbi:ATP-binding cassette domain-containing protein [Kingella kingae]|uniref:Ferrichrome ABC superfamily ATP binding cassette transporter, ABC protein n=2 Tax=Kingella kingae TaxID=504 RepID=F5S5U5_KINKI|nr:ATP-binding cassette domain-containing protein [Kingella kingae]EGK10796.1 ferrichrome ABC superfamily ATP binding cassette transporter, ABC protein [Kingella kingae ATCC 23330]MDK4525856.1 ATP-binding cassette domain-containing protein [Kingella kingae]MDK4531860.1 ATP-binding cassette domain-containing protein [Kingella kingae]MDK4533804.1 ATP-binding cassette domain-containing protein [Kingella kingae]MDK4540269.1 ATP-binding cassette domain-containing protein [Kingella kingae]
MIEIKNVSHKIGEQQILNNVSLNIPQNGITALIGANGAGKSTLMSFMARLQPLVSGSIAYNGRDLATTPTADVAKILAILTQENSIHSRISVRDLLLFGRYPYHQGRPTDEDKAIVEQAIVQFQLEPLAQRYLTELSGGQRQRALIAMVFCQSTEYVLLDEPLNNLDMYYAKNLMQLLRELTHEHNRTTVVVLHDINMAAAYADYVIAMQKGEVKFSGSPEEVFTVENIKELFDMEVEVLDHKGKKLIVHHI